METFRLLDMPPMTAAENMALDEALLELKGRGETPNTVRFLRFSPPAVLVGLHQSVSEEVRTGYCEAHGIQVNRRITGGGAIFFDESQLGWEIICDKAFFGLPIVNAGLFKALCDPVVTALAGWGLEAAFRPRNDIEIAGRKIAGTGGAESEDAFLFQGTLLIDFQVDAMLAALRVPVEKLEAREIDSIGQRVTCLCRELGHAPPLAAIKEALCDGFERRFHIRLEPGGLTGAEADAFRAKLPAFESEEWIDQIRPKCPGARTVQAACRVRAGLVRFTLVADPCRRRLQDLYITGDFLAVPARGLYDLQAALRGAPLDREKIRASVQGFFDQGKLRIAGMSAEDFLKPLDRAFEHPLLRTRHGSGGSSWRR